MPVQFLDTPNAAGSLAGAAAGYLLSNPARKAEQAKNEYAKSQDTMANKRADTELAINAQRASNENTTFTQGQDHENLRKSTQALLDKQIPEPPNADVSTPEGLAKMQTYNLKMANAWGRAGFPDEAQRYTTAANIVAQSFQRGQAGQKDTAQGKLYATQGDLNNAKTQHIKDYEKDLGLQLQNKLAEIGAQTDGKVKVASIQQAGAYARTQLQQEGATQRTGMTDDTKTAIANQTAALKLYDIQSGNAVKSDAQYYAAAKSKYHDDMVAWTANNKINPDNGAAQPTAPGMPPAPGAMPAAPSIGIPTGGGNSGEPRATSMAPLTQQLVAAGVPPGDAAKLARIAESESTGDPNQVEPSGKHTGLFQIDNSYTKDNLKDPTVNIREAVKLYKARKAAGGTGFEDWEDSRNKGAYGGWGHSPEFTNGTTPAASASPAAPHPLASAGAAAALAAKPKNTPAAAPASDNSSPVVQKGLKDATDFIKSTPQVTDDDLRSALKDENLSPSQVDYVMSQVRPSQQTHSTPATKTPQGKPAATKQALPKPAAPASPWAGVDSTRTTEDKPHQTNAGDVFNSIGRYFTGARDANGNLIPEKPNNTPGSQTPDSQGALSKLAMPIVVGELKKGTPAQAIVREMVQKHGFTPATAQAVVSQATQQLKPAAPGSTWK